MQSQRACLVINPRDGQNLAKLPAILAVFSAAGWHTDVVLKEYGGHSMELATEVARKGYDIVIGYGGDGTLNQVVNGLMNGKKKAVSAMFTSPRLFSPSELPTQQESAHGGGESDRF